ncbi:MAG: signal peptidase I [Nibricoccus sp.]
MASQPQQSTKARLFVGWLTSMFSVEGKMRANAKNWLELAEKVYHYRRDVISQVLAAELQSQIANLRKMLKERTNAAKLKLGIEELEGVMRRTGGKVYPKSTVQEYVEFFLVAAIVVLGIRTYFVQPFKIPTNSMWPTYNGMTPQVYKDPSQAPGVAAQALRFVAFGAQYKQLVAPESGKITIQVRPNYNGLLYYQLKPGRKWGLFSTLVREYLFYVGDEAVRLQVPEDFDFDTALREAFGVSNRELDQLARKSQRGDYDFRWVTLDREVQKGQVFLSFDIMTGDQLFVDRLSYHFVSPKPGDGFVFRTGRISGIGADQYYIKRLVGVPGDQLEIREPVLYRNGQPITGAEAFQKNGRREGKYAGYFNIGLLESGSVVTVPKDGYFALGDNSGNSKDSRYWGFVPRKDVVGRPLFIYYPFTNHWGLAP